jgi:hypothetical protein
MALATFRGDCRFCIRLPPEFLAMRAHSWLVFAILAELSAIAGGQDFRVDTEVFFGQEKQPAVEALTIFSDGRVYDFLLSQQEIVVFDPPRGQFTLLDETRRVKATVTTQDLMEVTLELESHAAKGKNALLAFAARPTFETTSEEVKENGQDLVRLTLAGKPLEYVALGMKPQRPEAARLYRYFADWYARLNATRPPNLPAGARLALNEELAKRELLPREIIRTITPANPLAKKEEIKSQHLVNWVLAGEDRKKIERAHDAMATFQPVSYDEFRHGPAKNPGNKQAGK